MQPILNHTFPRNVQLRALKELKNIDLNGLRMRFVDAKGVGLGSLAMKVATILQGKDKPTYSPYRENGDVVVVVNAAHIYLSQDKWETMKYWWHTGYAGGARELTAKQMWEKDPCQIIVRAVNGMLPKNVTRIQRMEKLKVFAEDEHPFKDFPLTPLVIEQRKGFGWAPPEGFKPLNPERFDLRRRI
uniref:uL13m n=1 Tax=Polytomella magna TaxID=353565 RepID=UPI002240E513|nr:Chain Ah, uL13m [Polytomella magna]8APN_Ah Chain Ah, uL13m [Polytomella magna]8APO_Ah Chain Ah, uL13m [Polytomella magna]